MRTMNEENKHGALMDDTLLYHYTQFRDLGGDFFSTQMLRFTPASELNDPFEFHPAYDGYWSREKIDSFYETYNKILDGNFDREQRFHFGMTAAIEFGLEKDRTLNGGYSLDELQEHVLRRSTDLIEKHREYIRDEFSLDNIGVLCFSEDPGHIVMWSHYADSHKGFVLGFKRNSEFMPDSGICNLTDLRGKRRFKSLDKVDYPSDDSRSPSCISGSEWITGEDERIRRLLFTKSLVWKYESEWRYLKIINPSFRYKSPSGRPLTGMCDVPPSAISRIYLGINALPELQKSALAFCRKHNIEKLYKGHIDKTKYKIEFLPIPI